jgi:hypothetical protein
MGVASSTVIRSSLAYARARSELMGIAQMRAVEEEYTRVTSL